eukprot:CAMPEP_0119108744 /NCGR_PEP_ID=MMETSP1180-20130426/15635_1 /TAXON_ID=3052 ORGANISM="Chlamydomonas cf sp, Strain CCMP681" /NCGR_SAMPLE_ID=MMETSP1180 /ASSEMBLY_ACC=CAM_ASM_000741 /LENGTH=121 /DNA_ID=CAMNT_0007094397 /DNA_START=136 /DNA_END=501 /DNA_ORIENTATION=+
MESPFASQQTKRDTRRVLQVLLPGLPPPAIDLVHSTFFSASITACSGPAIQPYTPAPESGRFKLRRMDSGKYGNLSLASPIGPAARKAFTDVDAWAWAMLEPASDVSSPACEPSKGKRGKK